MTSTTVRKLFSLSLGVFAFLIVALLVGAVIGIPMISTALLAVYFGVAVGVFEIFFVQSNTGDYFRSLRPIWHVSLYALFVVLVYGIGMAILAFVVAPVSDRGLILSRVPITLPALIAITVFSVLVLRVVGLIGAGNLWSLLIGRYQRPQHQHRLFMFVDLSGSTALTQKLGALDAQAFISRFIFDASRPITDNGGDIYKYVGDGLIASWVWKTDDDPGLVASVAAQMFDKIDRKANLYLQQFGIRPYFRVGIHGGEVVVSEQGDLRRSIEFNGDAINIAARMEQKAKDHQLDIILSEPIANFLDKKSPAIRFIGEEDIKGLSKPMRIFALDR